MNLICIVGDNRVATPVSVLRGGWLGPGDGPLRGLPSLRVSATSVDPHPSKADLTQALGPVKTSSCSHGRTP